MKHNLKRILFMLLASPALIWLLIHPVDVLNEWRKLPQYFKGNIQSVIGQDKLTKVFEERWNAFGPKREEFISKVYFNKGTVLVDDFFSMLTYISPRLYFQSGDGTSLSPPRVEPIATPLFIFWILGLINLIKRGKKKILISVLLFGLFAYIFGQRNLAFLFPILLSYLLIAIEGIENLKNQKIRMVFYVLISIYGLFLLGRVFLIK